MNINATSKSIMPAILLREIKDLPIRQSTKNQTNVGPQEKFKVNMLRPVKISNNPRSNMIILNILRKKGFISFL